MGGLATSGSRVLAAGTAAAAIVVLGLAGFASVIAQIGDSDCDSTQSQPSADAFTIPQQYLALYQQAGETFGVPWAVLAGIGSIESDHGRSQAPGVQTGVNAFGCCAGPMQFNLRDGPPSTWQRYRIDGNHDGVADPYDPADAIPTTARYLQTLIRGAHGELATAILGYNHSSSYVSDVLARAHAYLSGFDESSAKATCGSDPGASLTSPDLGHAIRREAPREYARLPAWAMAGGRPAELIDERLLQDALWLLRTYRLRVTAAREAGHNTHGDGTALDLVPAEPVDQAAWDQSAGAAARDLGWTPSCGPSGSRPICALVPAIQFVGYEGYPGYGSPRTCAPPCAAHLHVSWVSPCFGTSAPSTACSWVEAFAAPTEDTTR